MNSIEHAYRQGVADALSIVTAAAETIETSSALLRLRRELAAETLRAVAEEARALIAPAAQAADQAEG